MDIINQAMLFLLNGIYDLVGNYGLAVVLLTVAIRLILWPVNSSQTRNMKKMQELQPKLKELQDKHKDNPQKMQESMMKFYAEHKFNPMAGCLPMLIQLPIFIGLFGALNSPAFLIESVNQNFLFVDQLSATLHSHAGQPLDGTFSVKDGDKFSTATTAKMVLKNGTEKELKIKNKQKVLTLSPQPLLPGEPVKMSLNFKELAPALGPEYLELIDSVKMDVVDEKTKEVEVVTLVNDGATIEANVPTVEGKTTWNMGVLVLIIMYAVMMWLYQKVMSPAKKAEPAKDAQGEMQQKMMKMLPMMFVVMLFFIPMPAGVLLYLVVTTALMFAQTAWVNFAEGKKEESLGKSPSNLVVDVKTK